MYTADRRLADFYEFVNFMNVGFHSIKHFASVFNFDDITSGIWDCIVKRLLNKSDSNENKDLRYVKNRGNMNNNETGIDQCDRLENYKPFTDTVFDGIFNHLKNINKINTHLKITSSSDGCGLDVKRLVQNSNSDFSFYTRDMPNSWICFKFIKCQVSVSHYTIRTDKWNKVDGNHPRSWVIEGLKGKKREVIDERVNDGTLNNAGIVYTFDIQRNTNCMYNSIRMRLTDTNWANHNYLLINSIEFYGNIAK